MPATNSATIFTLVRPSETDYKDPLITDRKISTILKQLGISPKCSGFNYLKSAIKLCYQNPNEYSNLITKRLYPDLANTYKVKSSCIERGIRYVASDMHCEDYTKEQIFGYAAKSYTNKEIINSIAEYIRYL